MKDASALLSFMDSYHYPFVFKMKEESFPREPYANGIGRGGGGSQNLRLYTKNVRSKKEISGFTDQRDRGSGSLVSSWLLMEAADKKQMNRIRFSAGFWRSQ
jgi:hypothetical protein